MVVVNIMDLFFVKEDWHPGMPYQGSCSTGENDPIQHQFSLDETEQAHYELRLDIWERFINGIEIKCHNAI